MCFPGCASGKEPACQCRRGKRHEFWSPRGGRSPGGGNGKPLQYSCLENPMDRGAWQVTVHRVAKSRTWLKRLSIQWAIVHGATGNKTWLSKRAHTVYIKNLVVQWPRLCASNAGGLGSIPGQGTRAHMPQLGVHMPQLRPSAAR